MTDIVQMVVPNVPAASPGAAGRCASDGPTRLFVALGIALRAVHYLRNPSMWHDEGALAVNVLDKGYHALLGPLRFSAAAPPLFLWSERAVVGIFGDSLYALRAIPLLASCAALCVFASLARASLAPRSVPIAVMLFAFSDRMLWHTCEAKPYAVDILAGACIARLFCALRARPVEQQVAIFAPITVIAICASYPGIFLCAGLVAALAVSSARTDRRARLALVLLSAVVVAAALLVILGPVRAQHNPTIEADWVRAFPDWRRPLMVPGWAALSSVQIVDYCLRPSGALLSPLVAIGAIMMWRRGGRALVILLASPVAFAFAASCLRHYPFAGARVMVFALPAIALFIAEAVPPVRQRLAGRSRILPLLLAGALAAPCAACVWRAIFPWPRAESGPASRYVLARRAPGDLVTANDWEFVYYFRRIGPRFHFDRTYSPRTAAIGAAVTRETAGESSGRFWLVLKAHRASDRAELFRQVAPAGWHTMEAHDFADISVRLMERDRGSYVGPAAAQRRTGVLPS